MADFWGHGARPQSRGSSISGRRLFFEPLEDRRLLAALVVNSPLDTVANDGVVTLREAIAAANNNTATELGHVGSGADSISFAAGLSGQIIQLGGELTVSESLSIDGTALAADVVIRPGANGRAINITSATGSYSLSGVTLQGAVRAAGNISVSHSTISGAFSDLGSGIHAYGNVTVSDSLITGRSALGYGGGGIYATGDVSVTRCTISDNSAVSGPPGFNLLSGAGGGIYAGGDVTVVESTISGNFAGSSGGGIHAAGNATVTNSTIQGNSVSSDYYYGSYFPGNGGGIHANGDVTISSSTISNNSAYGGTIEEIPPSFERYPGTGYGGGISNYDGDIVIRNSIVAMNYAQHGGSDDIAAGVGSISVQYSLIGNNFGSGLTAALLGAPDANGNLIGTFSTSIDPLFDTQLQDNGGPTQTLALRADSPAINMGDPAAQAGALGVPQFDQRGSGFSRVSRGRVDMGAFEIQGPALTGDYNGDESVDAADYVMWRKTLSQSVGAYDGADGSGDGTVGPEDFGVWGEHHGEFLDDYANKPASALPLVFPSTVNAVINNDRDSDWFSFTAVAGKSHRFQVSLQGLAGATLRVIGSDGVTPVVFDIDGGSVLIDWTPSAAGTFYLQVSGFDGATGGYQLSVLRDDWGNDAATATSVFVSTSISGYGGTIGTSADVDWSRFMATAGETYSFRVNLHTLGSSVLRLIGSDGTTQLLADDDGGPAAIDWTASSSGIYYLEISGPGGATGTYSFWLVQDDHGNDAASATVSDPSGFDYGVIGVEEDVDWFSFSATAGTSYNFQALGDDFNSVDLRLIGSDGTTALAIDNDGAAAIDWTAAISSTYYLEVSGFEGSTGNYELTIIADEHGNNAASAMAVAVPSSTGGLISSASDVDWFSFDVPLAGYSYSFFAAVGGQPPSFFPNTVLRLIGTNGTTQLAGDVDGGFANINWTAPAAGTYYVEVGGFNGETGGYSLGIQLTDDHGNNAANARAVAVPSLTDGVINNSSDPDWFSFPAQAGVQYRFETIAGTLNDTKLTLYNTNGTSVITSDSNSGPGNLSLITWTAPASGTYFIKLEREGSQTGSYQMKISTLVSAEAAANATVEIPGVRLAPGGQAFFNIQGDGGDGFASYGVLRFNSAAMKSALNSLYGAGGWEVSSIDIVLIEDTGSFTNSGPMSILFTTDDSTNIVAGTSTLKYPHNDGEFSDAVTAVTYSFVESGDGAVSSVRLFDEAGTNSAGSTALMNDFTNHAALTLLFVPGAGATSATYAGITNSTYAGPTIVVSAQPVSGSGGGGAELAMAADNGRAPTAFELAVVENEVRKGNRRIDRSVIVPNNLEYVDVDRSLLVLDEAIERYEPDADEFFALSSARDHTSSDEADDDLEDLLELAMFRGLR